MKTINEKLDYVHKAKQHRTIVKNLSEFADDFVIRTLLVANFSDKITFPFPSGKPPYEPNEHEDIEVTRPYMMKLGACVKRANGLTVGKERIFINLLESVSPKDADILCLMKDGDLESLYPRITEKAVKEAIPDLL